MDIDDKVLIIHFQKIPLGAIDYILLPDNTYGRIVAKGFRPQTWMVQVTHYRLSIVTQISEKDLLQLP